MEAEAKPRRKGKRAYLILATALAAKSFYGRVALQGTVISFEKTFILQVISFLAVMPLLLFLRVKRVTGEKAHVELPVE